VSDDDPFEELEEDVGEREGDPFDRLGHQPDEEADDASREDDSDDAPTERDADEFFSGVTVDEGTEASDRPDEGVAVDDRAGDTVDDPDRGRGDPLDPEGTVRGPGDTRGASAPEGGTDSGPAFDSTDDLEAPELDRVDGREGDPFESVGDAFTEMDVEGVDADEVWEKLSTSERQGSVSQQQGRTYAEVSKHSYCEQCEFFSDPPEIDCSHEGTEIVEFLDMETVRVVDCPVVAERKELQDEG
jgi:hypothetical protein